MANRPVFPFSSPISSIKELLVINGTGFYMSYVLAVSQPTTWKHWRKRKALTLKDGTAPFKMALQHTSLLVYIDKYHIITMELVTLFLCWLTTLIVDNSSSSSSIPGLKPAHMDHKFFPRFPSLELTDLLTLDHWCTFWATSVSVFSLPKLIKKI